MMLIVTLSMSDEETHTSEVEVFKVAHEDISVGETVARLRGTNTSGEQIRLTVEYL